MISSLQPRCRRFMIRCAIVSMALLLLGCMSHQKNDLDALLLKAKNEKKAVMLELGSVGCVPCDMMQPVIVRLAEQYRGKMEVYFVDVKDVPSVARQFRIHGIPTQVFLDKEGNEFHRHVGFYEYEAITSMLKKAGI